MGIQMLALPLGDGTENKIFSSYTLSEDYCKIVEPAGRPFEELVKKKLRSQQDVPNFLGDDDDEEDLKIEEETIEYWWEKQSKEKSEKDNKLFTSKDDNYYAILGLEELFVNATESDIRKAYKRVALIYHPDKNKDNISENVDINEGKEKKEEKKTMSEEENCTNITEKVLTEYEKKQLDINNKWLKIKDAYDTLLDPDKRKKYDSTFEFDETIPEDEKVGEKDFFLNYGPVFVKNSIWSKKKPIPKIGDMDTPIEKVKRFYKFWYNFTSWRDSTTEGEYNLEEAGSRYEKRAMAAENKKMKASRVKEEKNRLNTLTSLAYKYDPRVIAEEEKLKLAREKEKMALIAFKEKERLEKEKKIEEYKRQQEELKKKEKENLAKEKEELIKNIVNLGETLQLNLSPDDIFNIQLNANIENMKSLIEENSKLESNTEKINNYK